MPSVRGLALLGPGLDGQLAIELVRSQGCEVIAATFSTPFTAYYESVCAAAARLQIQLLTLPSGPDYLQRVAHPRFGYTREMAPCLDCKTAMLAAARAMMDECDASFLITGDVVGQRLPGQSKRDFALVDFHAGVEGMVLRPLSAKILEPTRVETTGVVQRDLLLDINGRSRQRQLALAKSWGWSELPAVTSGCLLADAAYARRFRNALEQAPDWQAHLPLVVLGRHFRISAACRAILGRNADENQRLRDWHLQHKDATLLISPLSFVGPTAILSGPSGAAELAIEIAARLILQYAKKQGDGASHEFTIATGNQERTVRLQRSVMATLPAPI